MSVVNTVLGWFGFAPKDPVDGDQRPITGKVHTATKVSFDSAMTVSAVFASIRLLAETVASLPIELYELDANGHKSKKANNDIIRLLKYKPNSRQNRIEFIEQLMLNLVSTGNSYAKIYRVNDKDPQSRIVSMNIINSGNMTPVLKNGRLVFRHQVTSVVSKEYEEHQIWHVKLFGTGLMGLSPLQHAAKAIGVAEAADDKITNLMRNGAKPTGVLMTKGNPTADQREVLREELASLTSGEETAIPVLPLDMKFQPLSLTPSDIELLATRRFSLEEIARMFGVPSILINDSTQSTNWGSGIGAIIEAFHKFNLRPYLERLELSMLTNLMPRKDWEKYEFVIDADAILRANRKDRVEMHRTEIATGQRTPNEVRLEEGYSEREGGNELYMQINMGTLSNISKQSVTNDPQMIKDTDNA